jgi:hypothetical protein
VSETRDNEGSVSQLLDAYLETAERWDALQSDASAANAVFEENHEIYKSLRPTPEGREGIAKLMEDPCAGVRLLAATHSLSWASEAASRVLEVIEGDAGLHAVTARYTLRSYRAGKLDLDW